MLNWQTRSEACTSGIVISCKLKRTLCLFTLQKHSCIFESGSYICSGMHRFKQQRWNGCLLPYLQTSLLALWPSLGPGPGDLPITSEKTDVNLILRVCVQGTRRKLTADSKGPSATTVLISSDIRVSPQSLWSCQRVGRDEPMAYLYPSHLIFTSPQARNIKLTATYSEMCDAPWTHRHSELSAFCF